VKAAKGKPGKANKSVADTDDHKSKNPGKKHK
jgi:hypothetical protein